MNEQLRYEEDEMQTWKELVKNGAASRIKINEIAKGIAATKSQIKEAQVQLEQKNLKLMELMSSQELDAQKELAELIAEEAIISENIKRLSIKLERTQIKAMANGIITDLQYQTP